MKDFKRLLAYAKPYRRFWPGCPVHFVGDFWSGELCID